MDHAEETFKQVGRTAFGDETALFALDAVVAALVVEVVNSRPALGRDAKVALKAVRLLALTRASVPAARELLNELL